MTRVTHDELHDALARLNALLGTEFTMNLGPGGWAVQTGRQERRRPAKEMYWTLDFAIDMLERAKLVDPSPEAMIDRLDRFAEYAALVEKGFDNPDRALLRDDWRFVEQQIEALEAEVEEPAKPEVLVECPQCGGYGGFEEYEEGRIVTMPCFKCGATGKVPEGEFDGYRCDRCHKPVYSEGSWGDMADQGECATEDGGVLCPQCFATDPTVGLLIETVCDECGNVFDDTTGATCATCLDWMAKP